MKYFTYVKSLLFVCIVYVSFIINNSIGSLFISDHLLYSLILTFVLTELLVSGYKLIFSHSPGVMFYGASLLVSFSLILINPLLLENFVILFGLFVYTNLTSFLSQFFDLEDQLAIQSISTITKDINWSFTIRKGLFFDELVVKYDINLGFLHQTDKRNLFDIIKNNNGSIAINNHTSINIFFKTIKKNEIFAKVKDMDKIVRNSLIES